MTKFDMIFLLYLVIVSLVSFIITVFDKLRAKSGGWRVPEKTLLVLSFLGGSIAMLFTMNIVHHKTNKPKFMVGIPLIIVVQCFIGYFLCKYGLNYLDIMIH
ncbi:MAG: DUF1294 domain-containing protein [Clostridia bacterium]|nr:DUF1294 domain-containing protein [Clostridia bacterium]